MKVKIVQLDGTMMNLALSKIARHHLNRGDSVSFDEPNPDLIYYGAIFDWTAKKFKNQQSLAGKQIFGGYPFNDDQLPPEIDSLMPVYDLWGVDYSLGYTSRGCIRHCDFCIIPKKEGRIRNNQFVGHFHDPKHKKIILLDNNFFASPEWRVNLDYINDAALRVSFCQGLDLRIMTEEIAGRLADTHSEGHTFSGRQYFFAWDNIKDEPEIRSGLEFLKDAGVKSDSIYVYVLVGFDSTFETDLYRCQVLWNEYRVHPFAMRFNNDKSDPRVNALSRWACRPACHRNHTWDQYWAKYGRRAIT
jgi:hypothetical protein